MNTRQSALRGMGKEQLRHFIVPLRAALGILVLVLLLQFIDLNVLLSLTGGQVAGLGMITLGLFVAIWFEAERLRALCDSSFVSPEMVRIVLIGYFVTNFTPSSFGGDGYKVFALGKKHGYSGALALVLLERVLGLVVLLAVALFIFIALGGQWAESYPALGSTLEPGGDWQPALGWVVLSLVVVGALVAAFLRQHVYLILGGFFGALARVSAGALSRNVILTIILHTVRAAFMSGALFLMGEPLGIAECWIVLTVAAIASMLPLSPGGLGIREAAIVISLAPFSVSTSTAILVSLVFRLVNVLQAAAGAFLSLKGGSVADR